MYGKQLFEHKTSQLRLLNQLSDTFYLGNIYNTSAKIFKKGEAVICLSVSIYIHPEKIFLNL